MTFFGAIEIREANYMLTFKMFGQIHHCIDILFPENGNSQLLQINFISDADQVSLRQYLVPNLKKLLIE